MAKKEKVTIKKGDSAAKKGESATGDTGSKAKKGGKDRVKREGKGKRYASNDDGDDLGTELAALGLRIKDITGDGNCFFRALGDQMQGDEGLHGQLRQQVVSYMADHVDDFSPFVEDDESFGGYLARMKKDGVWAGYMEVVAASRCLGANLTIYQAGQPRWRVVHHPEDSSPMLHLSYHDGQHYNSVRCAQDFGAGPPAPVVIRGDGTIAARPQREAGGGSWDERDERRVATSTACTDKGLVRRALEEVGGDVEAAIERVIEALAEVETQATEGAATSAAEAALPAGAAAGDAGEAPGEDVGGGLGDLHHVDSPSRAGPDHLHTAPCAGAVQSVQGAKAGACEVARSGGQGRDSQQGAAATPPGGEAASGAGASGGAASGSPGEDRAQPSSPGTADAKEAGKSVPAARKVARGKATAAATATAAVTGGPSNNKRCPCGSNKKYKACCGTAAAAAVRRRAAGAADSAAAGASSEPQEAGATVVVAQVAALVI